MDVAEEKLEKKQEGEEIEKVSEQMDLTKTVLKCTAKLEAQLPSFTSKEVLQILDNTKLLEKKQ
eukprot:15326696-Ditylum_brightwellii.AAC.3